MARQPTRLRSGVKPEPKRNASFFTVRAARAQWAFRDRNCIGDLPGCTDDLLDGIADLRTVKGSVPESVKQGWQGGELGSRGGGESAARKAQAPARPLKEI